MYIGHYLQDVVSQIIRQKQLLGTLSVSMWALT